MLHALRLREAEDQNEGGRHTARAGDGRHIPRPLPLVAGSHDPARVRVLQPRSAGARRLGGGRAEGHGRREGLDACAGQRLHDDRHPVDEGRSLHEAGPLEPRGVAGRQGRGSGGARRGLAEHQDRRRCVGRRRQGTGGREHRDQESLDCTEVGVGEGHAEGDEQHLADEAAERLRNAEDVPRLAGREQLGRSAGAHGLVLRQAVAIPKIGPERPPGHRGVHLAALAELRRGVVGVRVTARREAHNSGRHHRFF
mmetsp:Transcript_127726/g.357621  ORF Transcript_127726/g.357621 Transcript_127726/m.357621 type:complete len:254 (+) Transcript_127726:1719-2480(+)